MIEQNYYNEVQRNRLNRWIKEFNVGSKLHEPKPFEDKNLLPKLDIKPAKKHSFFTKLKSLFVWK